MALTTDNCNVDLVICMDQSESINPDDYRLLQNFVIDILEAFPDLGPTQNQTSVLAFDNLVDQLFALNTYTNVNDAVDAVEDHVQGGGTTRIDLCIQMSTTVSGLRNRETYPRVLIVITDGRSSDGSLLRESLRASESAGFTRIAVGIGEDVDREELRLIAGEKVFFVDNFRSLLRLTDDIIDLFCTRRPANNFFGQALTSECPTGCPTCRPCPWDVNSPFSATNFAARRPAYPNYLRSDSLDTTTEMSEFECWPPEHKGPKWVLVARQSAGYYFRPYELTVNPHNPCAENYAILADLEKYRAPNSMFTFRLSYPCNNVENIWMQNNNPAIETTGVCCYKPLVIEDNNLNWVGLKFNGRTALMDGSSDLNSAFYSVGSFYEFYGGIQGFMRIKGVERVELYVLPPSESIAICRPPPEIPGTRKNLSRRAVEGTIVTYECECGQFEFSGQPYQDAICLPSGLRRYSIDDRFTEVELGEWVGLPREGDCKAGLCSASDAGDKCRKDKHKCDKRCKSKKCGPNCIYDNCYRKH